MLWQVESLKTLNSTVPRHKACWAILRLLLIRRSCYFSAILPLFWQDRNWRCFAVRVLDLRSYCASWFLMWQRSQGGGLMSKFEGTSWPSAPAYSCPLSPSSVSSVSLSRQHLQGAEHQTQCETWSRKMTMAETSAVNKLLTFSLKVTKHWTL